VAAAGYLPPLLQRMEDWDPVVHAVLEVLTNGDLDEESREEFRTVLMVLAKRFQTGPREHPGVCPSVGNGVVHYAPGGNG
jgi:hypothetical protein